MTNAFSKVKSTEGMPAMWRGISSVILGAGMSTFKKKKKRQHQAYIDVLGPAHAAYFVTYEVVKQAGGGNADAKHHPFVAGPLSY